MKLNRFEAALALDVLVCDGAMGTMLMDSGAMKGLCPEELNLKAPEVVKSVHRRFIEAGADIVTTNSFGGSRTKLSKVGLADQVVDINLAAARIAREEVGEGVVVAGDLGPLGEFLHPLGDITFEDAVAVFAEQAGALADGGVDFFIAETFTDLNEARAAVQGAKKAADLAVACTMTFEINLHTIMGATPAQAALGLREAGADLIGANCGTGPAEFEEIIREMRGAAPEMMVLVQPNAGLPKLVDGAIVYDLIPAEMGRYAVLFKDLGVKIIGSCCGSTPEHTRAIATALRGRVR